MIEFLIYDAKVALLVAIFYMFYRLMLARETFHRVNRVVLVLTAVASFILPFCVITMHETVAIPMEFDVATDLQSDAGLYEDLQAPTQQMPLWQILLPILFIIGMLATLGNTLVSMIRILILIRRSEKHPQEDGTIICVSGNAELSPFSWMRYIVMNRSDYEQKDVAILAHERGHIRLKHSWDLLLVDSLTALQWFNPAMWMLRSDLRTIHEYEADAAVLSKGINARQYQYLLITKAASIGGYSLANGISHSTLKNRINMMLHKKSNPTRMLKLLALVPIVAAAIAVNAETVTDYVYDEPETLHPVKKGKANATIKTGMNSAITVVATEADTAEKADGRTYKVYGVVRDKEDGSPIIGTIVQIANSNIGTVTGLNGEFAIDVQKGDALVAGYVGYASEALVVKDPTTRHVFELQKDDSNKIFDVVEEMPQFPGSVGKLFEYLAMNVRYPQEAADKCLQGRVIATFVVEKDGSVTNAMILKSVDPALDAEALRVVKAMPKWTPGKHNGEPVCVKYTVPISFRLQGGPSIPVYTEKGANQLDETVVVGYGEKESNEPYVIVDDKAVDSDKLKEIDPKTIEHMEVLKSKVAIEKYGEKGKNGVIIITIKKQK